MKINYSNLTFSQLVEKIGNSRFWDLPKMLQEVLNKLSGRVETLENAPTPSGGIETLSGDFVDNTDPTNPVLDKGYKVYTAIVNQTGTNAPVANVLENTIGEIVWTRTDAGLYYANLAGAFIDGKTFIPPFSTFPIIVLLRIHSLLLHMKFYMTVLISLMVHSFTVKMSK